MKRYPLEVADTAFVATVQRHPKFHAAEPNESKLGQNQPQLLSIGNAFGHEGLEAIDGVFS